jgi:hypothetical protein
MMAGKNAFGKRAKKRLCRLQGAARLARARAQRRPAAEVARSHAKTRPERRRDIAQEVAAAGAAPFNADRRRGIGAQPMAARFALGIDALNGEAGQILHWPSLSGSPLSLAWCELSA